MRSFQTSRRVRWTGLILIAALSALLSSIDRRAPAVSAASSVAPIDARLAFERNDGQHSRAIRFAARGNGYRFGFLDDQILLAFASSSGQSQSQIAMRFEGASPAPPHAEAPLDAFVNYFVGRNPRAWRQDVPTFRRVRYPGVYPGVDVVFYGNDRQIEYDVVVAPGANPAAVRVAFAGTDSMRVDNDGALLLAAGGRELRHSRPVAYQTIDAVRHPVDVAYRTDGRTLSFDVGPYDAARELVIDPVLVFSTYLGGAVTDIANDVIVDAAGATYVTGYTDSLNFPTSPNAPQPDRAPGSDAFVTKFTRDGALVYSTYFGGNGFDFGLGIDVDAAGAAYVAGLTQSTDLPTTTGAFQDHLNGSNDAFVLKLSASGGRIVYATYLGGDARDAETADIVVDRLGIATVVGTTDSNDFPTTPGALSRAHPAGHLVGYATRFNASGSALVYSTLLTGTVQQRATAVTLDSLGRAVIAGDVRGAMTTTTTFSNGGAEDSEAYVLTLNNSGSGLVYSTRFGGSGDDTAQAVALDATDDSPNVTGFTSSKDFPTTGFVFQPFLKGPSDAFAVRFTSDGRFQFFMTLLGGTGAEEGWGIDVSHFYITLFGMTTSSDFPLHSELQGKYAGQQDAFITRLNFGEDLLFSTYLGGTRSEFVTSGVIDGAGAATIAGFTNSTNYPTAHAAQPSNRSASPNVYEAFVSRASVIARGTPGPRDIAAHVADVSTLHGKWEKVADATAAGGFRLHNPDAGAPKLTAALANPTDYFEFTVNGLSGGPYMLWIRGKADGNSFRNDSVFVQFSNARNAADDADNERDFFKIGTTEGLAVNVEDCSNCGLHGWGWQDGGYGRRVPGPLLFFNNGLPTTVRVQRREDGVSIDQIVIAKEDNTRGPYFYSAPGYQKDDDTIVTAQEGGGSAPGADDIVLYPAVDGAVRHGNWIVVADAEAAGGRRLRNPDAGAPKRATPLAVPPDSFDLAFTAKANVGYRIWIRGRADANFWGNDSAYVQFSGSVSGLGAPMWRIGTTSATTYTLEDCTGCGLAAWGWNDNAIGEGALGPLVYFAADGPQTIRVQSREDGLSIDQIVLSPERFLDEAPGATKRDTVIVPRP